MARAASAYWAQGPAWTGNPITLTYSYVNMYDGGIKMPNGNPLPNSLIRGSIEESLRLWAGVVPIHFVEIPNDGVNHPNHIRFRHLYINGPDPAPPADPIAKAQATCIGASSGCEVQFDNTDRWQEVGTTPNPDILGASIHEVGHILGLHHTQVVGANMYWIFHRFQGLGTGFLLQDDIDGIRALYGSGVGSVRPIPEPSALALAFLTSVALLLRRPAR
jgi:hypothetical protein